MRAHRTETETIADRCFEEFSKFGRVKSDDLRRLFLQRYVKPADQALREEIVYCLFDLMGRKVSTVAKATGLTTNRVMRLVEQRTKRLYETPEGRERELARQERIEDKRAEGRVEVLDMLLGAGKEAIEHSRSLIAQMKPYEAARAATIYYKLAGLIQDQAKNPDAAGERLLDTETLETKAAEYAERRKKLTLVESDGSDQASA